MGVCKLLKNDKSSLNNERTFKYFPNPIKYKLFFQWSEYEQISKIKIFSNTGVNIKSINLMNSELLEINLPD